MQQTLPSKFGFIIDNRRCIGCHACTVACKAEHEVPIGVNRTWVKYIETGVFPDAHRSFHVMRCNHCEDAPCVNICPTGALFKRNNGIVDFNTDYCIACKACTQACPYDAIYIDPATTTAQKCNFCAHRVEQNLLPSCVVVCPATAIVAGDMNNPESKIAQILKYEETSVRKPEKNTVPKLFYVNGKPEALQPTAAPARDNYLWSAQTQGVGYRKNEEFQPADEAFDVLDHVANTLGKTLQVDGEARRVYDAPAKGLLWGRKVSSYIVTKAMAAGISGIASLLSLFDLVKGVDGALLWSPGWAYFMSLLFLGVTSGLLVWDLGRPERFLMLLQRGNKTSWLVRGAYVLMAFGGVTGLLWLGAIGLPMMGFDKFFHLFNLFAAGFATVYTGFLFAQARGRDLWQNPRLILHFAMHAPLCGLSYFLVVAPGLSFIAPAMLLSVAGSLFLLILDEVSDPGSADARAAHELMKAGDQAWIHWGGVWGVGHVLPILLLSLGAPGALVAVCVLVGLSLHSDQVVTQPQRIALS